MRIILSCDLTRRTQVPIHPGSRSITTTPMPRYIALLRGINVGNRRVKMSTLKAHFAELPFTDIAAVLASGNILFNSPARSTDSLENKIAVHLQKALGWPVPTLVRSQIELTKVVNEAPLGDLFTDKKDASTQVTFFQAPLAKELVARINAYRSETDAFVVGDRELYWRCSTKLTESPVGLDKTLNPLDFPKGTTRNLQTLRKLLTA